MGCREYVIWDNEGDVRCRISLSQNFKKNDKRPIREFDSKSLFCHNVIHVYCFRLWFLNKVFASTNLYSLQNCMRLTFFISLFKSVFPTIDHYSVFQLMHSSHLQWSLLRIFHAKNLIYFVVNFFNIVIVLRCCWHIHLNNCCNCWVGMYFYHDDSISA